jgi:uncharacterized protein YbaR (Trm112 family)
MRAARGRRRLHPVGRVTRHRRWSMHWPAAPRLHCRRPNSAGPPRHRAARAAATRLRRSGAAHAGLRRRWPARGGHDRNTTTAASRDSPPPRGTARAFDLDVLACPRCGGRLRLIATVEEDPEAISAILAALAGPREMAECSSGPALCSGRKSSDTLVVRAVPWGPAGGGWLAREGGRAENVAYAS